MNSKQVLAPINQHYLDKLYRGEYIPCSVYHLHSCEMNALLKFITVFNMAYKFYLPIHILPKLIFKRARLLQNPLKLVKDVIKDIIYSCLFLSVYVSLFWYFICKFKNIRGKSDKYNIMLSSLICSWSAIFEAQHRRVELGLYMFPRFMESMFLFFEKRGYVKSIKNGDVYIFAVTLSLLMYNY